MSAIGSTGNMLNPLTSANYPDPAENTAIQPGEQQISPEAATESGAKPADVDTLDSGATYGQSLLLRGPAAPKKPIGNLPLPKYQKPATLKETIKSLRPKGTIINENIDKAVNDGLDKAADAAEDALNDFAIKKLKEHLEKGLPEVKATNMSMVNDHVYENKPVAYTDADGKIHVATFSKKEEVVVTTKEDGTETKETKTTWYVNEGGEQKELKASTFNAALKQTLPESSKNCWVMNQDSSGNVYIERRVRTAGGEKMKGFISGTQKDYSLVKQTFKLKGDEVITLKADADEEKLAVSASSQKLGLTLDTRYNLPSIMGFGGKMGDQNGAIWAAARKSIGDNAQLSLAYGYAPENNEHMLAIGAKWHEDVVSYTSPAEDLKFNSSIDGTLSTPFYFDNSFEFKALMRTLMDSDADVTWKNKLDWDAGNGLSLSAGYTASFDAAHTVANIILSGGGDFSPIINQYAEFGLKYNTKDLKLSANAYMPISISDTRYERSFRWDVKAEAALKNGWQLKGSAGGAFDSESAIFNAELGISKKGAYGLNFKASAHTNEFASATVTAFFTF